MSSPGPSLSSDTGHDGLGRTLVALEHPIQGHLTVSSFSNRVQGHNLPQLGFTDKNDGSQIPNRQVCV